MSSTEATNRLLLANRTEESLTQQPQRSLKPSRTNNFTQRSQERAARFPSVNNDSFNTTDADKNVTPHSDGAVKHLIQRWDWDYVPGL